MFFTSGPENMHFVERVTSGQRLVLAFWFTCNAEKQFEIFLDGKQHTTYSHRMRASLEKRKIEQELAAASKKTNNFDINKIPRRKRDVEKDL